MKQYDKPVQYTTEEKEEMQKERKFRFDGRITAGNLISIMSFIAMGFAAWRNMESRLLILEERVHVQTATVERIEKKLDIVAINQERRPRTYTQ